jgi:hypothetical protein
MTISKNNFEAYLLDYIEGNLDALLTAELMAFLAENPEFEQYLPDNDNYSLSAVGYNFESKKLLKKDLADVPQINAGNFDEFCIAAGEGLLDNADLARLNEYMAEDPVLQRTFETYQKLRLRPDLSISCTEKHLLKKQDKKSFALRTLYYGLSIAASIAIIVLLISKNQGPYPTSSPQNLALNNTSEATVLQKDYLLTEDKIEAGLPSAVNGEKNNHHTSKKAFKTQSIPGTETQYTENNSGRETIPLEKLNPLAYSSIASGKPKDLNLKSAVSEKTQNSTDAFSEISGNETRFTALLSKVNFWKTAESAISGFNQLTEAKLSISKTVDESGKLMSLQVQTESYTIAGNNLK